MSKRWNLMSAVLAAGVVLVSACGGTQPATTTEAPTTSTLQSTTTVSETTTTAAQTTTTVEQTTTSTTAQTTSTTLAEIIPGVASMPYEDKKLGFSIARPKSTSIVTQGFEGFLPLTQTPVVAFTLPEELFKGSNLGEAGVYIGVSTSAAVTAKWNVPVADSAEKAAGTTEINGVSFAVFESEEAAAGNIYQERVYRTLHGSACFEIVELLHSGELGNYPPNIVQFDKAKFEGYLEGIVRTFVFTISS